MYIVFWMDIQTMGHRIFEAIWLRPLVRFKNPSEFMNFFFLNVIFITKSCSILIWHFFYVHIPCVTMNIYYVHTVESSSLRVSEVPDKCRESMCAYIEVVWTWKIAIETSLVVAYVSNTSALNFNSW